VLAPPRVLASRLAARCRVATAVRWPQSREDYAATYDALAGAEIDRRFGTSRPNFEIPELGHIDVDSADSWTDRWLSSSARSAAEELVSQPSHIEVGWKI
jgi:hypothetical protein